LGSHAGGISTATKKGVSFITIKKPIQWKKHSSYLCVIVAVASRRRSGNESGSHLFYSGKHKAIEEIERNEKKDTKEYGSRVN
jgi:mannitol/fructose-specific phosphotransferase system IIA component (Ntr-type)